MAKVTINIEGRGATAIANVLALALADYPNRLLFDACQLMDVHIFSEPEEVHSVIGGKGNPNHEITYTF